MPYQKAGSAYAARRAPRKAMGRKKPEASKALIRTITSVVKKVESKSQEHKLYPASVGLAPYYGGAAGATFQHLTGFAQGVGDFDRTGDEVTITSLHIRGIILNGDGATANRYNDTRIMVFQYNDPDMTPVTAGMFITNTVTGAAASNAYSCRNIDYLGVYNVLFDETYHTEYGVPNALNYGTTGALTRHFEITVPLRFCKKKIQFTAGSTNTTNGLWLLCIGSSASAATNPTFGFSWCCQYTDS